MHLAWTSIPGGMTHRLSGPTCDRIMILLHWFCSKPNIECLLRAHVRAFVGVFLCTSILARVRFDMQMCACINACPLVVLRVSLSATLVLLAASCCARYSARRTWPRLTSDWTTQCPSFQLERVSRDGLGMCKKRRKLLTSPSPFCVDIGKIQPQPSARLLSLLNYMHAHV